MENTNAFIALIVVAIAAVWDYRQNRIPNWLTFSAIPTGIAWNTWIEGFAGFQFAMIGFAVGFGLLFILFATGGGGGGDVKLMGTLGAWVGMNTTLTVFFLSAVGIFFLMTLSRLKKLLAKSENEKTHTVAFAIPVFFSMALLVFAKVYLSVATT